MSGKYLHDGFSLPCPPGLKIPEEVGYPITPNTLKVLELTLTLEAGTGAELGMGRVVGRRSLPCHLVFLT